MAGETIGMAPDTAIQRCIEPGCGAQYAIGDRLYVCRHCGGLLDIVKQIEALGDGGKLRGVWTARFSSREERDRSGVWRFRELLPFADGAPVVTLFEGNTPLYDAPKSAGYCGLQGLWLKHQGMNPTGSFKDTGMTVAVTQALVTGARTVVCASTGNTAASLAAYAARADLQCAILVPHGQVSLPKLAQGLDYGARVLEIDGNFDDAMRLIRELAEDESIYLVNSINPFRIEGQKTVAVEVMEQLEWQTPDHVVLPGGNLGNSSALGKGFMELFDLKLIKRLPRISVVQAEGAAPFARLFTDHKSAWLPEEHLQLSNDALTPVPDPQTLATAIKIGSPVSWKKSLRAVVASGGSVLSVSEQEIADAKAIIGRDGTGCEPASATTVAGIKRLVAAGRIKRDDSVVAVLTGHLLKDTDYAINYHRGQLNKGESSPNKAKMKGSIAGTYANSPVRIKASKTAILEYLNRKESVDKPSTSRPTRKNDQ